MSFLKRQVALGLAASSLLFLACNKPARDAYRGPVAPYSPYVAPAPYTPPWPLVPVGATPPPVATAIAPKTSVAATSAAPSAPPSISAGPMPVGPVASTDPEIDGPPDVADVEIGPVAMSGGTVPDVSASVARMHGTFRRCYRAALVMDIKTTGDLLLVAQIGDKGQVVDAVADQVNGVPVGVVTCLIERVSKQGFSRPTVAPTTLRIRLHLLPTAPQTKGPHASR